MMRMRPEAEGYSGQVSCGGAARRLGLRRLTANTSMYALPCGFAVVGESPRLTR